MQFTEKQLGDLFIDELDLSKFLPFKKWYKCGLIQQREKPTDENTRADYVVYKPGRLLWVVEFKLVADAASIKQAYEYYELLIHELGIYSKLSVGKISIAAQFFKDDALFFAQKLGVETILISPINFSKCQLTVLTRKHFFDKANIYEAGRNAGCLRAWDVLNG